MKIVFCGKCGVRLSDQDYPGGLDAAPAEADLLCRECGTPTTVQLPVASRDRSSESKLKPARGASASSTQPGMARKSGIQAAPPEESFAAPSGRERKKHEAAAASPPASLAIPIVGSLMGILAVLILFLTTRGSSEPAKEASRTASEPAPKQSTAAPLTPASSPRPAASPKTQAPSNSELTPDKAARKSESGTAKELPPAPRAPEPAASRNTEAQKPADPPNALVASKSLAAEKASSLPDSEEEEALEPAKKPAQPIAAKTPDKDADDIGLFKPKNAEPPAPSPAPKAPEPEKKNAELEQKLRKGEWISIYTREDRGNWKLEKPDGWKLQGDALSGSGRLQYNGISLTNYEMKADVSLQKGESLSFVVRSNDEIAYRLHFSSTSVAGQIWDFKQKKVKKTFEKANADTKGFQKILVQSKGRWLRVIVNDKDVLIEYDEVPLETTGFYFSTYRSSGAVKNVSIRALF